MNIKEIQKQVNQIIKTTQNIENPQTDELMKNWLEQKRDFIECFGGEPIYEHPKKVYFELGLADKKIRIDNFINMLETTWQNYDLAEFIDDERDGFFNNQVIKEYTTSKGDLIPVGAKLVKAFKFFESNDKALHDIQSAASMIIQEDKVEGTLCLSVHPCDFLTSSDNDCNWRTCHSLQGGEYASGNLSYMIDHATVMCYIKKEQDIKINGIKWNSKKWRVLLFLSDDWKLLFAGRQYPFTTEVGLDFVKKEILPQAGLGEWSDWCRKKYKITEEGNVKFRMASPYIPLGDKLVSLADTIIEEPNSLMFNDLLYSSCYDPLYAYRMEEYELFGYYIEEPIKRKRLVDFLGKAADRTKFHIGGKVDCCRCGKPHIEISESFMCTPCELEYGNAESDMFAYCPNCDSRYLYDDGVWVNGAEESVCPDCAAEYVVECENCGETYYKADALYDRRTGEYICKYCFEDTEIDIGLDLEEE